MKKLLVSIFAVALLTGCSGSSKTQSKTCKVSEGTMEINAKFDAKDDKVTKATFDLTMDMSIYSDDVDLTKMKEEEKKALEDQQLKRMGIEKGEGVEIDIETKEKEMIIKIAIDVEKGDPEVLKASKLGIEKNMKLSEVIKGAEEDGATCK